jgi:hypothetical protein
MRDAFGVEREEIAKNKVTLASGVVVKLKPLKKGVGIKATTKSVDPDSAIPPHSIRVTAKQVKRETRKMGLKSIPTKRKQFPKKKRPPKEMWKSTFKKPFKRAAKGKDSDVSFPGRPPTARKREVGRLDLDKTTREISMIETNHKYRRQGVATHMLDEAQRRGMNPRTSTNRLPDGEKFAQAIARRRGIDVGENGADAPWEKAGDLPDARKQLDIIRPNPFTASRRP